MAPKMSLIALPRQNKALSARVLTGKNRQGDQPAFVNATEARLLAYALLPEAEKLA
jgi:hypothetical protein